MIINRRNLLATIPLMPAAGLTGRAAAQPSQSLATTSPGDSSASDGSADDLYQLDYPDINSLGTPQQFGYKPASEADKAQANQIINLTPKGPAPIDVAESFVTRFYSSEPKLISQWPKPDAWNPLVVRFFEATSKKVNNDMVAWCAAFANWCISWSGGNGSNSADSQSFLGRQFKRTSTPKRGDLAVFTCFDPDTGKSLGLGHVTFFKAPIDDRYIQVVGGNQAFGGHSSVISDERFPVYERDVHRHLNGKYVPCKMRLNTYVELT